MRVDTASNTAKIGILIVAYNAESTLAAVLDRIPKDFRSQIAEVLVSDDHSQDSTYLVGLGYQQLSPEMPITIVRQSQNLGYGGNQKAGYAMAIERGLDVVVLLHADGQYAPESLPELVAPILRGEADAVLGSRMMMKGAARRGGMPFYKYVGNVVLTGIQNWMLGTALSEFHSGYRAYSVDALKSIPYVRNSSGFNFDTQIVVQLHDAGMRIAEVPIPTFYGDEICYVNGLQYARDVVVDVLAYRLHKAGFGDGSRIALRSDNVEPPPVSEANSWDERVVKILAHSPPVRVLDLGCANGKLAQRLRSLGHYVVGVDGVEMDGVRMAVDDFYKGDLDQGIPREVGSDFDFVVATEVIEQVRDPGRLLAQIRSVLRPGGRLILTVPNIGHWYPRMRTVLGMFAYDQRGILSRTHLRFFTRRSIASLAERQGFVVARSRAVGVSANAVGVRRGREALRLLQAALIALRPTLFGYQFVFELRAPLPATSWAERVPPRAGTRCGETCACGR